VLLDLLTKMEYHEYPYFDGFHVFALCIVKTIQAIIEDTKIVVSFGIARVDIKGPL